MKKVKRCLFSVLTSVVMIVCGSVVNVSAYVTESYAEVVYTVEDVITIDKGDPVDTGGSGAVKTGDMIDLYNCFVIFSFSALGLFFILAYKKRKEQED